VSTSCSYIAHTARHIQTGRCHRLGVENDTHQLTSSKSGFPRSVSCWPMNFLGKRDHRGGKGASCKVASTRIIELEDVVPGQSPRKSSCVPHDQGGLREESAILAASQISRRNLRGRSAACTLRRATRLFCRGSRPGAGGHTHKSVGWEPDSTFSARVNLPAVAVRTTTLHGAPVGGFSDEERKGGARGGSPENGVASSWRQPS
jgi:hypothetical protein